MFTHVSPVEMFNVDFRCVCVADKLREDTPSQMREYSVYTTIRVWCPQKSYNKIKQKMIFFFVSPRPRIVNHKDSRTPLLPIRAVSRNSVSDSELTAGHQGTDKVLFFLKRDVLNN